MLIADGNNWMNKIKKKPQKRKTDHQKIGNISCTWPVCTNKSQIRTLNTLSFLRSGLHQQIISGLIQWEGVLVGIE